MIGRFASGLGKRVPATLVAGVILSAAGSWYSSAPMRHSYPEAGALTAVHGEAFDAIEVRKRRGALTRFLAADPLEFQAVLAPGERIVLYDNTLPRYGEVKAAAVAGEAVYHLWQEAPDERDRLLIWQLDGVDGRVVSRQETVTAMKAEHGKATLLPMAMAVVGMVLVVMGMRAQRL